MKLSQQKLLHYMQEKPKRDFFTDKIIEIIEPRSAEDFIIVSELLKCVKTTRYNVIKDKFVQLQTKNNKTESEEK